MKKVDALRAMYPIGCLVKLIHMDDKYAPPAGAVGKVVYVDDIGQVHVAWENGSSLALIDGVDSWVKI